MFAWVRDVIDEGAERRRARKRIRRRLAAIEQAARKREEWVAHNDPWSEHDTRTCEYCVPVARQVGRPF